MATKKPKLNVSLLQRIVRHLRAEPKRYRQSDWGKQVEPSEKYAPACGTQGCIAGWAVLLTVPQSLWHNLFDGGAFEPAGTSYLGYSMSHAPVTTTAHELLGLTNEEAFALFQASNQSHMMGPEGVKEAAKKIGLLIRDRAKFVNKYL